MMFSVQPAVRRQRSRLFVSSAVLALATAIALPHKAQAQTAPGAFQGTPTTSLGTVSYDRSAIGSETITVGSANATINWSPYDSTGTGPIDFLPNGYVATFVNDPNLTADYTVLNRIVPTDPTRTIMLNGQIVSQITDGINTSTGGHVWFYSPGGILIGSNAVIDVGGLLLSTADLPNGFTADSSGFSAYFSAPTNSTAAVQILPGAQINALQQNSYVALVGPRVEQGGTVKVDGSAAYVAATGLTMTMNQGLFDIQVDVGGGTDDAQGVVHTGSTTGGGTASLSANHRLYMVAVPKNQALTMLLGGTAGFDASVAGYDNGQIVLSTGYNVNDLAGAPQFGYNAGVNQPGAIQIDPGTYLSDLVAYSDGRITASATGGGIDFRGDVSLTSNDAWDDGVITLSASNGNMLNVDGNLRLLSVNPLTQPTTQVIIGADTGGSVTIGGNLDMAAQFYPGYGGSAQLDAFGGTITIGGVATVIVDGIDDPAVDYGDQRRGGSIGISASDANGNDGAITANGMVLSANAVGHDNAGSQDWQLVDATGGTIDVNPSNGGAITVNGDFSATASAFGGQQLTPGFAGGVAAGGEIHVGSAGGVFHITGNATLNADGIGGDGAAGIDGGGGYGGLAQLYSVGDGIVQVDGTTLTSASGTGGNGQDGGYGQGGHSGVSSIGGSVTLGGNAYVAAEGTGGNASLGFGGTGGSGQGGVAYIEADSSQSGTAGSIAGTTATISSNATGGTGGAGDGASIAAGAGGSAAGGLYQGFNTGGSYALADVNGASLSLTSVVLSSSATGGAGGAGGLGQSGGIGGNAIGGTAQAGTWNPTGTTAPSGSAQFADVNVLATGRGGNGGAGGSGDGNGGTGTGGGSIFAAAGDTSATYVNLNANGTGGNGANGGAGYGGSGNAGGVLLYAANNANMIVTGGVDLRAIGQGGNASTGTGGTGYGGDATIQVGTGASITGGPDGLGGTLPTGDIWVYNKGQGGNGGTAATGGAGGDGYGGNTWLLADGLLHTGMVTFRTIGAGGTGGAGTDGFGGDGGYGHGGTTIVDIGATGAFDSFVFTGFTTGVGGNAGTGTSGLGNGGDAQGGSNSVTIDGEASAIGCADCGPEGVPLGFVVTAYGFGANGQNGGNAAGGTSSITVNGSLNSGSIVEAAGQAGAGTGTVNGGNATAGSASITVNGSLQTANVFVGSNATAGKGGSGNGGSALGGASILAASAGGTVDAGTVLVAADAFGGSASTSGNGGNATGGTAEILASGPGSSISIANVTLQAPDYELNALLSAQGFAGSTNTGTGGTGTGGLVILRSESGANIALPSDSVNMTRILARGLGGNASGEGGTGGLGVGGEADIGVDGATMSAPNILPSVFGQGGSSTSPGLDITGGNGIGGIRNIYAMNGGLLTIGASGGQSGGLGGNGSGSGNGGSTSGGSATLNVASAQVVLAGPTSILGQTIAGNGAIGGNAMGPTVSVSVTNGGSITSSNPDAQLSVGGIVIGGNGTSQGGSAYGSPVNVYISPDSSIDLAGTLGVYANASAGTGDVGGNAYGGDAEIDAGGSVSANQVEIYAQAFGGTGGSAGGGASGGTAKLNVSGTLATSALTLDSSGNGGNASTGVGGDGSGGDAEAGALDSNGHLTVSGLASVLAVGTGGSGSTYGGFGYGGTAGIYAGIDNDTIGGSATLADALVQANGLGGNGAYGGQGFGGYAFAGTREGSFTLTGTLTGQANGTGGTGTAQAGIGWGGSFLIAANFDGDLNPAITNISTADIQAIGVGGNGIGSGIAGADGNGGSITIQAGTANSSLTVGTLTANAKGNGGNGGDGATGGAGGYGYGGSISTAILGTAAGGNWAMLVRGVGGDGGSGSEGLGGDGGYGEGGSTSFYSGSLSSINAGSYSTSANGLGGAGGSGSAGLGNGGQAQGGYNEATLNGPDANYSGQFLLTAFAMGGNGATGGAASGGTSTITVNGSLDAGYVQSTGQAQAGNGTAMGGNATGGNATIQVNGSLSTGNAVIGTNAQGGQGVTGGSAYGGYSGAIVNGSATFGGSLSVQANARGGAGSLSGDGGFAQGGESNLDISSGATVNGAIDIQAFAIGGNGANGGAADGGYADMYIAGTLAAPLVSLNATGTGGNGINGNGGDSSGGYASLYIDGGNVGVTGNLVLNANGNADLTGDGIPDGGSGTLNGGDSYGGAAIVQLASGSLSVGGETDLLARAIGGLGGPGTGGVGGTGGAGFGGEAIFEVGATSTSCTQFCGTATPNSSAVTNVAIQDLVLNATGRGGGGGSSTTGGTGGVGDGGFVLVDLQQGSFSAGYINGTARGAGGDGGTGSSGVGGDGGSASGGQSYLWLAGGASLDATSYLAIGNAQGGNGGSGAAGSGDGGAAASGLVQASIDGAASMQSDPTLGFGFVFTAFAQGGNGAIGGSATAGSSSILVNGSLSSGVTVQASASAVGGNGSISGGSAQAGSASITVAGNLVAGRVNVMTNGIGGSGSGTSADGLGGSAGLTLDPAATTSLGDVFVSALGSGGSATVSGDLIASGIVDLEAGGDISFANVDAARLKFESDSGSVTGGNIAVSDRLDGDAAGAIQLGNIDAGPGLPSDGESFSVGIASQTSITVGDVTGAGAVGFATLGDLDAGNISAGSTILALVGGDISTGSLTTASTGQIYFGNASMFLAAGGPDNFDPSLVFAQAPVATGGSITVGGPVSTGMMRAATGGDLSLGSVSAAGDVALTADGSLASDSMSAGGTLTASAGASLATGDLSSGGALNLAAASLSSGAIAAGGALNLVAGGNVSIGNASSGQNMTLAAGGDLSAGNLSGTTVAALAGGNLSVHDVDAGTSASFTAGGLATFLGTVDAPTITVTSGDIDIAGGASLGVKGTTNLIVLNAINDSIEIGGNSANPGSYHLSEEGGISANALVFNAIGSGEGLPSVTIHDVQVDGSQTAGSGVGSVTLNTLGSVFVDGNVSYVNAGASDVLAINAGNSIAVDTDSGSITMTGTGGSLAGTLALTAHNVWVADGALLAQLQADPNFAGRDAALATNNGATNPGGYLQAGGIVVTMTGSTFLVQNSGTAAQPAGLTIGDGGLTIVNAGSDPAAVILSGRQVTSGGTTVDGDGFAKQVQVQSAGGLTSDSSVNGCAIGGCAPEPQPQPAPPPQVLGAESILGPVGLVTSPGSSSDPSDDKDDDKKSGGKSSKVDPAVYLINTGPMHVDQIIDTPVTSGNDSPAG